MNNNETPKKETRETVLNIAIAVDLILLLVAVGYLVYTLLFSNIENVISRGDGASEYRVENNRDAEDGDDADESEATDSFSEDELSDLDSDETGEFILPGSDSKYLSESDLIGMSAEECRLARNEIYARHGRMFDAEDLQQYFASKSWYVPTYSPSEFQESWLNDYEVYNRDLIVEYEKHIN